MTAAWPATMPPYVQQGGYGEQLEQGVSEFKPPVGPRQSRNRSIIDSETLTFELNLSTSQVTDLSDFYSNTIGNGTLPFTMTHPRTGITETFTFVSAPEYRDLDFDFYRASINVRKMP